MIRNHINQSWTFRLFLIGVIVFGYDKQHCYAQENLMMDEVKALFPDITSGIWINHYYAESQDGFKYILALGYDNTEYRGLLNNIKTKEKLIVEGHYSPTQIKWIAYDSTDQLKYSIIGSKLDSTISVEMLTTDRLHGSKLLFVAQNRNQLRVLNCAPQIYIHTMRDTQTIGDRIIIQRHEDESISGSMYHGVDQETWYLSGLCSDPLCDSMNCIIKNAIGSKIGKLKIKLQQNNNLIGQGMINGKNYLNIFQIDQQLPMQCIQVKDGNNSYAMKYIAVVDKAYLKWNQTILADIQQQQASVAKRDTSSSFYMLMDLELWNENIVSANYHYLISDQTNYQCKNINYNLRSSREIVLEDFFEKDFDYKNFLKEAIAIKAQFMKKNLNDGQKKWIDSIDINNWNIREEGIVFNSSFSPVYGTAHIIVLYTDMMSKMRKSSLTKKLIKL